MSYRSHFVVLWATSERFSTPQLVGAWSEGLNEAMPEAFEERVEEAKEWFEERVEEAKEWFLSFGFEDDSPWTFWTTQESVPTPERPRAESEAA